MAIVPESKYHRGRMLQAARRANLGEIVDVFRPLVQ